jgi:hypothetical protein
MAKTPTLPPLPGLPGIGKMTLPALPTGPAAGAVKTIAQMQAEAVNPLDKNLPDYQNNMEHDAALDMGVIEGEFAAIHAARKQQADAIELANDSEYWFCMYFQSREQKDAFIAALGLDQNKYIDGAAAAAKMGIELPKRPAKYKVGRMDKKLTDLT